MTRVRNLTSSRRQPRGFSRRAFLRGSGGLVVALPLLESMGSVAHAQGQNHAKRFVVLFSHGGEIMCCRNTGAKFSGTGNEHGQNLWRPTGSGETLTAARLGAVHQGILDPFVDDLLLLEGVDNMAGRIQGPYGGAHGSANVTALTCSNVSNAGDDAVPSSASIDQVLATRLQQRQATPFPSIDLQVSGHQYGTPFYRGADEAVSSERNPRAAFDRLFAGVTANGEPDPAVVRARALKGSVLDGVLDGLQRFRQRVSSADRALVDAHLEHVRSIEQRVRALPPPAPLCTVPERPGTSTNADVVGPLQADLIVAALRCGLSNVATFQIADIITTWLPTPYGAAFTIGHSLGHAARDVGPTGAEPGRYDDFFNEIIPNRRWRQEVFARVLQGLKDSPEGEGTMLDESVVLFTSEFSTGAVHSVADLPLYLAGKGGGYFRTGRHLNYNTRAATDPNTREYETTASTHNVYTSILHAFGYDDAHFGSDHAAVQGPLAGLT